MAWCRQEVPSVRGAGGGPPAAVTAPLAVLVRAYSRTLGVSMGGAQATIKAAFGLTALGIDVDLTAVDPLDVPLRRPHPRHAEFATSLFLRKINIAISVPVAVAAARGAGTLAVGILIGRIVEAARFGPNFDPFDEAYLAAFMRDLVGSGMVLRRGDTATGLVMTMAAALECFASATSAEAIAAAWPDTLTALGLEGCQAV